MESRSRVTLATVAKEAECSVATASKALSGALDVAPSTRRRVQDAANELGYLATGRRTACPAGVPRICMAFDMYGSIYSNELLAGALVEAEKFGHRTDIALLPQSAKELRSARAWIADRKQGGCRGALLVTGTISAGLVRAAEESSFSLVAIDPKRGSDHGVVGIGATNWAGGFSAAEHLLELGHQRIGFVGLDTDADYSIERFAGFRSALERWGRPLTTGNVYHGGASYASGLTAGERIARQSHRPTAVVCAADTAAFGVIGGLKRAGLSVPQDLSVVGFDDIPPAAWVTPTLTTVRQPLQRMGGLGVRTLLRLIDGREPDSARIQLSTQLIVRESTEPPTSSAWET